MAYQGPDQIKLEIVVYPIRPSGGGVWGDGKIGKIRKKGIFSLRTSDQILMKFDAAKNIVFQSSYFKSRPDQVTLGEESW